MNWKVAALNYLVIEENKILGYVLIWYAVEPVQLHHKFNKSVVKRDAAVSFRKKISFI